MIKNKPVELKYYSLLAEAESKPEKIIQEFQDRGWNFIKFIPSPSPRTMGFHFRK
ncbi:MAG: hypothetical protein ACTSVZ_05255 [Promethearchaeota archaeon]